MYPQLVQRENVMVVATHLFIKDKYDGGFQLNIYTTLLRINMMVVFS
jgi:hypothetical protein